MYNMNDFDTMNIEEIAIMNLNIKQYLEEVSQEIKQMFCQNYGEDVAAILCNDIEKKRQIEQTLFMLTKLTSQEQKVMVLRFGFFSGESMTLDEVAEEFGVTRERIRQIEAKAVKSLHPHCSRNKKLEEYL